MATALRDTVAVLSIDDAVEAIWELSIERGISITDAAHEVWKSASFNATEREMLAVEGLQHRARAAKHEAVNARDGRPGIAWGAPHGRKWPDYLNSLTHAYHVGGQNKRLIDFTRDDLAEFAVVMRRKANGYGRRSEWASQALAILDEKGKDAIGDLGRDALREVATLAAEAFGRQE